MKSLLSFSSCKGDLGIVPLTVLKTSSLGILTFQILFPPNIARCLGFNYLSAKVK